MPRLSLNRLFIFFLMLEVVIHRKNILEAIQSLYQWFSESLEPVNHFPANGRCVIAFGLLLLLIVIIVKIYLKKKS